MRKPCIILSNRLEELCDQLKKRLFEEQTDLFEPRYVVVPTAAMKNWVQLQLAADSGVAMGLRFLFLEEAVTLLRLEAKAHLPSRFELALKLDSLLPDERKALAPQLSNLFHSYALYGAELIAEWESGPPKEWQQELWQEIFRENWSHPLSALQTAKPLNGQLHLFGFSQIPPTYLRLFLQVPAQCYVLSPCWMFWEDICSDRERRRLRRLHQQRGAKKNLLHTLDQLLRDRNPLLANLGRLGRDFSRQLLDSEVETHECHELNPGESALQNLQADLLHLRPERQLTADSSIEVHSAPNRKREVEVLHSCIRSLIHREGIAPADIIVMTPDIGPYAPYLASISSEIPFHLQDTSGRASGLEQLFRLASSRWTIPDLMKLLKYPPLMERHNFTEDELETLRRWALGAGVRWGWDSRHRDQVLRRDYGRQAMADKSPTATWRRALSMLMQAVALDLTDEELAGQEQWMPAAVNIDSTQLDLLGKVYALLTALYQGLEPLICDVELTLAEWLTHLEGLRTTFFQDESPAQLELLRRAAPHFPSERFHFSHLLRLLEREWQRGATRPLQPDLSSVTVCTMLPMRALPSKAVILLGMDEQSFPRRAAAQPLSRLPKELPTLVDADRYLFLEALLSARKTFTVIYKRTSDEDGQLLNPSLVVSELLRRLPAVRITHHPPIAFHHSYFSEPNCQATWLFYLAKAHYGEPDKPSQLVIWKRPEKTQLPEGVVTVSVRALRCFARDPVRTYYNEALGVHLIPKEWRWISEDEPFVLNFLDLNELTWKALDRPVSNVIRTAERATCLPLDPFRQQLRRRIEERAAELAEQLAAFDLRANDLHAQPIEPLEVAINDSLSVRLVGQVPHASPLGLVIPGKADAATFLRAWPLYLLYRSVSDGSGSRLLFLRGKKALEMPEAEEHLRRYLEAMLRCRQELLPFPPDCFAAVNAGDRAAFTRAFKSRMAAPGAHYFAHLGELPPFEMLQQRWEQLARGALEPALKLWEAAL